MRLPVPVALLLSMLWPPGYASAHLGLDAPTSRYGPDTLKTGPCGVNGGERTNNVTYFEPGETIDVVWNEYVEHPGHYRIAFDPDGDDDFVDPATMMELYSNEAVLLDGIPDQSRDNRNYLATVTLPDIECDNCTLQVIQVMYDKPPYTTPGNDIYYQCADLVLKVGVAPDGGAGESGSGGSDPLENGAGGGGLAPGDSSGCSASSTQDVSWVALPLILLLARRLARASRLPV